MEHRAADPFPLFDLRFDALLPVDHGDELPIAARAWVVIFVALADAFDRAETSFAGALAIRGDHARSEAIDDRVHRVGFGRA